MDALYRKLLYELAYDGSKGVTLDGLVDLIKDILNNQGKAAPSLHPSSYPLVVDRDTLGYLWQSLLRHPQCPLAFLESPESSDPKPLFELPEGFEALEELCRRKEIRFLLQETCRSRILLGPDRSLHRFHASAARVFEEVAKARAQGIPHNRLAKKLRLDPRSLFHYCKTLRAQGLLVRRFVIENSTHTAHSTLASRYRLDPLDLALAQGIAAAEPLVEQSSSMLPQVATATVAKVKQKIVETLIGVKDQVMLKSDLYALVRQDEDSSAKLVIASSMASLFAEKAVESVLCWVSDKWEKCVRFIGDPEQLTKYYTVKSERLARAVAVAAATPIPASSPLRQELAATLPAAASHARLRHHMPIEIQLIDQVKSRKERGLLGAEVTSVLCVSRKFKDMLMKELSEPLLEPASDPSDQRPLRRVCEVIGRERRYHYYYQGHESEGTEHLTHSTSQLLQRPTSKLPLSLSAQVATLETAAAATGQKIDSITTLEREAHILSILESEGMIELNIAFCHRLQEWMIETAQESAGKSAATVDMPAVHHPQLDRKTVLRAADRLSSLRLASVLKLHFKGWMGKLQTRHLLVHSRLETESPEVQAKIDAMRAESTVSLKADDKIIDADIERLLPLSEKPPSKKTSQADKYKQSTTQRPGKNKDRGENKNKNKNRNKSSSPEPRPASKRQKTKASLSLESSSQSSLLPSSLASFSPVQSPSALTELAAAEWLLIKEPLVAAGSEYASLVDTAPMAAKKYGFIRAKMPRLKLFHRFLWDRLIAAPIRPSSLMDACASDHAAWEYVSVPPEVAFFESMSLQSYFRMIGQSRSSAQLDLALVDSSELANMPLASLPASLRSSVFYQSGAHYAFREKCLDYMKELSYLGLVVLGEPASHYAAHDAQPRLDSRRKSSTTSVATAALRRRFPFPTIPSQYKIRRDEGRLYEEQGTIVVLDSEETFETFWIELESRYSVVHSTLTPQSIATGMKRASPIELFGALVLQSAWYVDLGSPFYEHSAWLKETLHHFKQHRPVRPSFRRLFCDDMCLLLRLSDQYDAELHRLDHFWVLYSPKMEQVLQDALGLEEPSTDQSTRTELHVSDYTMLALWLYLRFLYPPARCRPLWMKHAPKIHCSFDTSANSSHTHSDPETAATTAHASSFTGSYLHLEYLLALSDVKSIILPALNEAVDFLVFGNTKSQATREPKLRESLSRDSILFTVEAMATFALRRMADVRLGRLGALVPIQALKKSERFPVHLLAASTADPLHQPTNLHAMMQSSTSAFCQRPTLFEMLSNPIAVANSLKRRDIVYGSDGIAPTLSHAFQMDALIDTEYCQELRSTTVFRLELLKALIKIILAPHNATPAPLAFSALRLYRQKEIELAFLSLKLNNTITHVRNVMHGKGMNLFPGRSIALSDRYLAQLEPTKPYSLTHGEQATSLDLDLGLTRLTVSDFLTPIDMRERMTRAAKGQLSIMPIMNRERHLHQGQYYDCTLQFTAVAPVSLERPPPARLSDFVDINGSKHLTWLHALAQHIADGSRTGQHIWSISDFFAKTSQLDARAHHVTMHRLLKQGCSSRLFYAITPNRYIHASFAADWFIPCLGSKNLAPEPEPGPESRQHGDLASGHSFDLDHVQKWIAPRLWISLNGTFHEPCFRRFAERVYEWIADHPGISEYALMRRFVPSLYSLPEMYDIVTFLRDSKRVRQKEFHRVAGFLSAETAQKALNHDHIMTCYYAE